VADIFISYARPERTEAECVKAALEREGLSVFLDIDGLDGGDDFSSKLDREVKSAGAVVGLWSPTSLSHQWVKTECDIGKRRGVLIPVAIKTFKDIEVPAIFWNIHFIDLTACVHDLNHPNWQALHRSVARTLDRRDETSQSQAVQPRARTGNSGVTVGAPTRQQKLVSEARAFLIAKARRRETVTTVDVANWLGIPYGDEFKGLLNKLALEDQLAGVPILTGLVSAVTTGLPLAHYWPFVGLAPGAPDDEKREKLAPERERIFAYWGRH